jgi:glycosyltransferase involved in cell wall biosynthesis
VFREVVGDLDFPLVPVDDDASLAAAISHYLHDTDRALESGRAGADRWAEAYTIERMTSAHESVYRARVSQH